MNSFVLEYSGLRILAIVYLAPICFAAIHAIILISSLVVTEINISALAASASSKISEFAPFPIKPLISYVSTSFSTRLSFVSIIVTSSNVLEKSAQRSSPTLPPPTIITFTSMLLFLVIFIL